MSRQKMDDSMEQQIVNNIRQKSLTPPVAELAKEYDERIGIRDEYLWRWLETIWEIVTLDCVPEERRDTVATHKTVLSMYITVVDDLAGNLQDARSLHEASKIPFDHTTPRLEDKGVRTDYLQFLKTVWETSESLLSEAIRETEFRPLLEYDFRLGLMSMDYEELANTYPEMLNVPEMLHYTPHNVMMLVGADIDLMHSPSFDRLELAAVRETIYRSQQLCRIGNCASTWERELLEGDLTSLVCTEALSQGLLTPEQLEELCREPSDADLDEITNLIRQHGFETALLRWWDQRHAELLLNLPEAKSVDLEAYVQDIEVVRAYQIASAGHK